ncbi:MAG: rRNA cytosine-C5-methylase [Propionibacteriaceae bacterium]|nr:rRNA cytosine-C5-methylase [Propionibacteriaceae bacterium]
MAEKVDPARTAAFAALKLIREGGYANLSLKEVLSQSRLSTLDAGFVTELVYGVCRGMGTLDLVIEAASGRKLSTLQPGVVDIARLGTEQLLRMRVPSHAAVSSSVDLAKTRISPRVTGVVNAILRRVAEKTWDEWIVQITSGMTKREALAIQACHPKWIVDVYADCLPEAELLPALEANNHPPVPTLVARPTLISREDLVDHSGGEPTPYSPWGVIRPGDPSEVEAVRDGRAGVQDEGSQLVAGLLAQVEAPQGQWLDLCSGPGGKTALLTGLAREFKEILTAVELHPHRADLVAEALRAYPDPGEVLVGDGRTPELGRIFSRVLVDAPCTGLGALRRRPEARWRKMAEDLTELTTIQKELLASACASAVPGAVVAYVTCSPHLRETAQVVQSVSPGIEILDAPGFLPQVPNTQASSDPRFLQLWPHRHGTDAMFCALLRMPDSF